MSLEVFFPLLDSLDLTINEDCLDAAMFAVTYFTAARAKDILNAKWGDLEMQGKEAFNLQIRQHKNADASQPHRFGRIKDEKVCMSGIQ